MQSKIPIPVFFKVEILFIYVFVCTYYIAIPKEELGICYQQHQAQVSKSQSSGNDPIVVDETATATVECMEPQSITDNEEWDPPSEFADMLIKVTEPLNKSTSNVKQLEQFLKYFRHPLTRKPYIDVQLFGYCNTPEEIISVLYPQYISFKQTYLLKVIVNKFGDKESEALVKQYEENFSCRKTNQNPASSGTNLWDGENTDAIIIIVILLVLHCALEKQYETLKGFPRQFETYVPKILVDFS